MQVTRRPPLRRLSAVAGFAVGWLVASLLVLLRDKVSCLVQARLEHKRSLLLQRWSAGIRNSSLHVACCVLKHQGAQDGDMRFFDFVPKKKVKC